MRGVAALYVVLFHAFFLYALVGPAGFHATNPHLLNYGWIGVDFFFVLSGFLLSLPLLSRAPQIKTGRFWRGYLSKRWLRIAPPYYASLLVVLVMFGNVPYLVRGTRDVIQHAFYVHNFSSTYLLSINPVYWTLAIEFQFYLILPLLAFLFARRRWPAVLGACVATSLAWRWSTFHPTNAGETFWLSANLLGFLAHFALGVAAARVYAGSWRIPGRSTHLATAALLLFIALPLFLLTAPGSTIQGHEDRLANVLLRPLVAVGFALFILAVAREPNVYRRLMTTRPMVALGEMSYSVYLLHFPLILLLLRRWPESAEHGFALFLGLAVVVGLAGSAAFYAVAERPFLWLKARLLVPVPRPTAPAQPIVAVAAAASLASVPTGSPSPSPADLGA